MPASRGSPAASGDFVVDSLASFLCITQQNVLYLAVNASFTLLVAALAISWLPKLPSGRRVYFGHVVAAFVASFLLAGSALQGVWDLRDERWFGVSPASSFFLALYTTHNLLGIIFIALDSGQAVGEKVLLTVHHLLSMGVFGFSLRFSRSHFWACLAGCCETTNVFLNIKEVKKLVKHDCADWLSVVTFG